MKLKLGDAIKEARIKKNLTQSDLAEGICTQATISNLEHNTSIPTVETLRSIAAKLMLNFNDLVAYYPARSGNIDILMESKKLLRMPVSIPTIYRAIYHGLFNSTLSRDSKGAIRKLRHKGKQRKTKDYIEKRGQLPISYTIHERLSEAETRSEIGHWEIDTVLGK